MLAKDFGKGRDESDLVAHREVLPAGERQAGKVATAQHVQGHRRVGQGRSRGKAGREPKVRAQCPVRDTKANKGLRPQMEAKGMHLT